jgi:hypothetical protein
MAVMMGARMTGTNADWAIHWAGIVKRIPGLWGATTQVGEDHVTFVDETLLF